MCGQGNGVTLTRGSSASVSSKRYHATKQCNKCKKTGSRFCGSISGYECDEFPYASTTQLTRHVMYVKQRQNSKHGGFVGGFYRRCNVRTGMRWVILSFFFQEFSFSAIGHRISLARIFGTFIFKLKRKKIVVFLPMFGG